MNTFNTMIHRCVEFYVYGFVAACVITGITGTWGEQCDNTCSCNATNTDNCDAATGCVCKVGWQGADCSQDIDECSTPNICGADSTCVNVDGGHDCSCNNGYSLVGGTCTGWLHIDGVQTVYYIYRIRSINKPNTNENTHIYLQTFYFKY